MADQTVFPTSYSDPVYAAADQSASAAVGIPNGWLQNIRTLGEKSNADQVSSAGARTPYQITPDTRQAILKQTGVDPYLNPQTAAYGAAYLLKQSMDRNGGNPILATAEYHGGTDPSNWGNKTMAYVKRVTGASPNNATATPSFMQDQGGGAQGANPYQLQAAPDTSNLGVGMPNTNAPSLSKVFAAYKAGQMDPQSAAEFEQDVRGGKVMLPQGMQLNPTDTGTQAPGTIIQTGPNGQDIGETPPAGQQPQQGTPTVPQSAGQVIQIPAGAVSAFNNGQMPPDVRAQMQADIQAGRAQLPQGATLTDPNQGPQSQGFAGDVGRQLGLTARDAIQAVGNTVGLGYDPIAATLNQVGALVGHDPQIAPLGAQAAALANKLGLPQPVGNVERGVNAAAQGVAEAGTFAGAGRAAAEVPGIVGQLGKTFGADAGKQAAAMAAGQAASQHAADAGYSPAAQLAINLGTMALTMGGVSALEGMAGQASPAVAAVAQRMYGATKAEAQAAAGGAERVEPTMGSTAPQEGAPAAPPTAARPATASAAPGQFNEVPPTAAPINVNSNGVATPSPATESATAATAAAPVPAAQATAEAAPGLGPAANVQSPELMQPSELAAQTRKAVGAQGAPFGLGKNAARDILATQAAPDQAVVEAANRLGVTDLLDPDHMTTNQSYRELAQAIKSNPGSLAGQAQTENLQSLGQRAQALIEKAGGTTDLSELSAEVKNQHQAIIDGLGDTAESLYGEVNKGIPAGTAAPAPNTLAFINQRLEDLGGNARNLTDGEQRLLARLTPKEQPMTVGGQMIDPRDLGLEPELQQPTYALLDNERQHIGMALDGQLSPFSKSPVPLLKKLYGELAQDQEQVADDMGVGDTYRTATATVAMRKSYEDDMTKLFGRQLGDSIVGKLGTAVQSMSKGDETKFVNLMKQIPENLRQKAATSGLQYAFGNATKNGTLNFKSFADWMDGVKKNSGAFNALMASLPADSRRQFLDLATVSRGVANSLRENISTGRIMAARQDLGTAPDGLMSKVLDKGRQAAIGAAVTGGAHVGGPVGAGLGHAIVSALTHGKPDVMKAADELLVSPEFTQLAKSGGAPTEQQIKAAANSGAMRRFYALAKEAAAPNDSGTRERWLAGAINSVRQENNSKSNR
ncbi:hypothetical protein B0G76_2836 [Paraburkholderia sp. BL23I1N1]|uniref:lytic transglycosylase domain-containing protein n=1 Tax=Paraburkholderia sp. BL23I1N1 TaxID=1938802 RepID=UPI000E749752|nr:lytic transglycosylase domain-containing protein [Paraburkholderia sp. BL23I1N1]RKE36634.1 hypothetical protein B0G76_2836 [Paraburkholderia sp. BL23I1N1]